MQLNGGVSTSLTRDTSAELGTVTGMKEIWLWSLVDAQEYLMCFRGILENTGGIATYISQDSDPCPFSTFISNHLSRRNSRHKHNHRRRPDEEYSAILVTRISRMVFCVLGWWEYIGENDRPREIASRRLFVCRVDKDALHGVGLCFGPGLVHTML